MKKSRNILIGACLLLGVLLPGIASAQNTQNFTIASFSADYYLDRNASNTSTLKTVETIIAEFPDYDQNHGILRAIPKTYQDHTVSLKIDSVTDRDGRTLKYSKSIQNDNLVLKIGDPKVYVHGLNTYVITYEQKNVAGMYSDHDELYWNVNGDQWQQPFTTVSAKLHISNALQSALRSTTKCFVGSYGSPDTSRCNFSSVPGPNDTTVLSFSSSNLLVGESMTFVTGFKPNTFQLGPEIAQEKRDRVIRYALIGGGMLALPLVTFIYIYRKWWKYGREPQGRGVIIPEYQPPKGLNVLSSDYIYREKLNTKAISALVIELAVKKYLEIDEVEQKKRFQKDLKTYNLKIIKDISDLSPEQLKVIEMFFGSDTKVGSVADLNELKNKLASGVKQLKSSLGDTLSSAGYFSGNPEKATTRYAGTAAVVGFIGLFLTFTGIGAIIGVPLMLSGLILGIFSRYMPARSPQGVVIRDHMLGLRDYIKLAEEDRLKYLQSTDGAEKVEIAGLKPGDPKFKVKLFESLLPYAIVFGLESSWAKQFKDIYNEPPDWYNGNWATFNTVYLVSSLNSFSAASNTTFTAPSSSGSGFSGGFSGGGGGGGGGGGW